MRRYLPWPMVAYGTISALLIVLSFPSYAVWWLVWLALVPFLYGLISARSLREVLWLGAPMAIIQVLVGMSWVSYVVINFGGFPWIVGALCLVIFSLFSELQWLVFAVVAFYVLQHSARLEQGWRRAIFTFLVLPLAYVGFDFINPKIFPTTLGHVLYPWLPVVQVAEYTGEYWFTFLIFIVNFALVIFLNRALGKRAARGPAAHGLTCLPSSAIALIAVGLVLAWSDHWGRARMAELDRDEAGYTRKLKVSIVQGNIGDIDKIQSEKGYEPAIQFVLGAYRRLTLDSVARFHPDLIIWPETSYPFLYTHMADRAANAIGSARDIWMKDFMGVIRTPIYFGSYSSVNKRDYNTAFLVKPPYELAGVYRKSILLAFGEYVPLGPLSPFILGLVPSIADFGRGPGPMTVEVAGVKLGPQICYEGIVPAHSRGAVLLGADALLNITNDSWFGLSTEPWFHLLLTAFRSIELRRPLIRGTNTGFSAIVDIDGEIRYRTRLFEEGTIDTTMLFPGAGQQWPDTFYLRHGELFAGFGELVAWGVLGWIFGPPLLAFVHARARRRGAGGRGA